MSALSSATFDPRDLRPPHERGTPRALLLAIGMHALLVILLWVGVAWHTEEPEAVQAELWSSIPQIAAPAPPIETAPEQRVAPEATPAPATPPVVETPKVEQPDIALERKREDDRRKIEELKLAEEQRRADAFLREQQRQRDEALKREQERQQLEADKKLKAEQAKKELADKKLEQKRYADAVQRLTAMAGQAAPAGAPSTGNAARNSGPRDGGYGARISQRIRSNTVFDIPPDLAGNPEAKFSVDLDPAGYVIRITKLASSGLPGFDEAVERAIHKSEPFPPDSSGRPPSSLEIRHHPKDH